MIKQYQKTEHIEFDSILFQYNFEMNTHYFLSMNCLPSLLVPAVPGTLWNGHIPVGDFVSPIVAALGAGHGGYSNRVVKGNFYHLFISFRVYSIYHGLTITRWTRDRQRSPSSKELRAHKDGSMGKAETSHTSHTLISLLKGDSNLSLAVKNLK